MERGRKKGKKEINEEKKGEREEKSEEKNFCVPHVFFCLKSSKISIFLIQIRNMEKGRKSCKKGEKKGKGNEKERKKIEGFSYFFL